MSTSQVALYTNRVGRIEKMRCNKRTDRQTNLWHIYSRTPTYQLPRRTCGATLRGKSVSIFKSTVHRVVVHACNAITAHLSSLLHLTDVDLANSLLHKSRRKIPKMGRDGQTKLTLTCLLHISSRTPTHKLFTGAAHHDYECIYWLENGAAITALLYSSVYRTHFQST